MKKHYKVLLSISIVLNIILGITFTAFLVESNDSKQQVVAEEFQLEKVDFSRVRNNDVAYTTEIVCKANEQMTLWTAKREAQSWNELIIVTKSILEYMEDIYDSLPKDCDKHSQIFLSRIIKDYKNELVDMQESYEESLERCQLLNNMTDTYINQDGN